MGLFDTVKSWLGLQYTIPARSRTRRGKKKAARKKAVKKESSKKPAKPTRAKRRPKKKESVKKQSSKPPKKAKKVKKKPSKREKKPAKKKKPKLKPVSKPKKKSKTAKKPLRRKSSVSRRRAAPKKKKTEREIGTVTHYFSKISVGIIKLSGALRVGRTIRFKGAHDDFIQTVESMQVNHRDVTIVGRGAEAGLKVIQRVHQGDKVYLVED